MTAFDDNLLFEEDWDNIENDNEEDEDVDESSSDKEEMKKILKIGKKKKEVDKLIGRKTVESLSSQNAIICSLFEWLHDNYEN